MADKKGVSMLLIVMMASFLVVACFAGYFLIVQYVNDYNSNLQNQNSPAPINNNQQQSSETDVLSWKTYTNDNLGLIFKYPSGFNTKYASFQQDPVVVINAKNSSDINKNGCHVLQVSGLKESQVTIHNMQFCLSSGGDPGAGQLYNSYYYTTLKNGNYVTLEYVVHTLNGCGAYMGTADYAPCTDFMNNYDANVVGVIQNSVATLEFTK